MNSNLINELIKPWTEQKVHLWVKTNGYLLGLSITLIFLTVKQTNWEKVKRTQPYSCED